MCVYRAVAVTEIDICHSIFSRAASEALVGCMSTGTHARKMDQKVTRPARSHIKSAGWSDALSEWCDMLSNALRGRVMSPALLLFNKILDANKYLMGILEI